MFDQDYIIPNVKFVSQTVKTTKELLNTIEKDLAEVRNTIRTKLQSREDLQNLVGLYKAQNEGLKREKAQNEQKIEELLDCEDKYMTLQSEMERIVDQCNLAIEERNSILQKAQELENYCISLENQLEEYKNNQHTFQSERELLVSENEYLRQQIQALQTQYHQQVIPEHSSVLPQYDYQGDLLHYQSQAQTIPDTPIILPAHSSTQPYQQPQLHQPQLHQAPSNLSSEPPKPLTLETFNINDYEIPSYYGQSTYHDDATVDAPSTLSFTTSFLGPEAFAPQPAPPIDNSHDMVSHTNQHQQQQQQHLPTSPPRRPSVSAYSIMQSPTPTPIHSNTTPQQPFTSSSSSSSSSSSTGGRISPIEKLLPDYSFHHHPTGTGITTTTTTTGITAGTSTTSGTTTGNGTNTIPLPTQSVPQDYPYYDTYSHPVPVPPLPSTSFTSEMAHHHHRMSTHPSHTTHIPTATTTTTTTGGGGGVDDSMYYYDYTIEELEAAGEEYTYTTGVGGVGGGGGSGDSGGGGEEGGESDSGWDDNIHFYASSLLDTDPLPQQYQQQIPVHQIHQTHQVQQTQQQIQQRPYDHYSHTQTEYGGGVGGGEHTYREYTPSDSLQPLPASKSSQPSTTTSTTTTTSTSKHVQQAPKNMTKKSTHSSTAGKHTSGSSTSGGGSSRRVLTTEHMPVPETLYTSEMSLFNTRSAPSTNSGGGAPPSSSSTTATTAAAWHSTGTASNTNTTTGTGSAIRTKQPNFKAHKFSIGLPSSSSTSSSRKTNTHPPSPPSYGGGIDMGGYEEEYEYEEEISALADPEAQQPEGAEGEYGEEEGREYELRSPEESMLSDHPHSQHYQQPQDLQYSYLPQPQQQLQQVQQQQQVHMSIYQAPYQDLYHDPFSSSAAMYEYDDANVQLTDLIE